MKENFDDALKAILKHEGGFVNHPKDPGGMTNLGVTKKVWEEWVGHAVDEKAMRALTPEVVAPMYKKKYWDAVKADEMPDGLDYLMFDFAVNAGPGRAIKLVAKFSAEKEAFYRSLPTFATFGKGWLRRVAEAKTHAESMLA